MSWGYACCHSHLHNSYCVGEAGKNGGSIVGRLGGSVPAETSDEVQDAAPAESSTSGRTKTLVEKHQDRLRAEAEAEADSNRDRSYRTRDKGRDNGRGRQSPIEDEDDDKYTKQAKRLEDGETPDLDKIRLKKALEKEKKRKAMDEEAAWQATKKGKVDVTQEDVEAYRLSKQAFDDPMANYKDPEEE